MSEKEYKAVNKPAACTMPPWSKLVKGEDRSKILTQIRQESTELYGQSYDECPKRHLCLGTTCLGRPLPWKSRTAKPFLEALKSTHKIEAGELFISNCEECPIKPSCKAPCKQVNDFLNRWNKKEVNLIFKKDISNIKEEFFGDVTSLPFLQGYKIPWDCLNTRRCNIVKKYLFQRLDFKTISTQENLSNQARVKYEYYAALTKMSEYAVIRKFMEAKGSELTRPQLTLMEMIYLDNMTMTAAAKKIGITKQAAKDRKIRVFNKYNLRWHKFVRKQNNKVIYDIPEVLR